MGAEFLADPIEEKINSAASETCIAVEMFMIPKELGEVPKYTPPRAVVEPLRFLVSERSLASGTLQGARAILANYNLEEFLCEHEFRFLLSPPVYLPPTMKSSYQRRIFS
jgi:hypothetical protein